MALSARNRILAGLGVVLSILVGSSAIALFNMAAFKRASDRMREAQSIRTHAREGLAVVSEARAYGEAYHLSNDAAFFAARGGSVRTAVSRLHAIGLMLSAHGDAPALRDRTTGLEAQLRTHQAEHDAAGPRTESGTHGLAMFDSARTVLRAVSAYGSERLTRADLAASRAAKRAVAVTLVGTLFAIAVALAFAHLFQLDVRRRHEAEDALRSNEAQFRSVVGVLAEGVILMDRSGVVQGCNRAAADILGLKAEQIMALGNRDWHGIADDGSRLDKEDHPAFVTARTGEAQRGFLWGLPGRHGARWLRISSEPVINDLGVLTGVVSSFRDVTEHRAAEARLRETNEQRAVARDEAQRANMTKSDFLAHMSHELRTPLNSVIGFANVLRANKLGNLMPDQLKYLERVHENGRHLLDLINGVLDLSKVEAGHMDLDVEDVALGAFVYQTLSSIEGQVKGKPLSLTAEVPADVALLRADRRKLRQVLINLVGNAIKFTPEGAITVRVVADEHNRPIRLDVSDTGIGIPFERQQAVFEAFQQADSTTLARQYGGTGLGLTITRSLLQLMGYHITVASEAGKGSTFSVHFHSPMHTAAPDVPRAA